MIVYKLNGKFNTKNDIFKPIEVNANLMSFFFTESAANAVLLFFLDLNNRLNVKKVDNNIIENGINVELTM